jgi:hypothetical protein
LVFYQSLKKKKVLQLYLSKCIKRICVQEEVDLLIQSCFFFQSQSILFALHPHFG